MSLMYYAETQTKRAHPAFITSLGLDHIIEPGGGIESRGSMGPKGAGLLFRAVGRSGGIMKYLPDSQSWHECDGGAWWVGYDTRPGPEQLQRPDMVSGDSVVLEDGNEWQIPAITALPVAFCLTNGQIDCGPSDRFAGLREDADRVYQKFVMDVAAQAGHVAGTDLTYGELFDISARAISINYRVSKWEIAALRLLTTDSVVKVASAMVDIGSILEASKKNVASRVSGASDMMPGNSGYAQDIAQPMQTSIG